MDDFTLGILVGGLGLAVVYVLVSPLIRLYQNWVRQMQAVDKKQVVMHFTDKTPAEVWHQAVQARIKIALFWSIVFAIVIMLYAMYDPIFWASVKQTVRMLYEEISNG